VPGLRCEITDAVARGVTNVIGRHLVHPWSSKTDKLHVTTPVRKRDLQLHPTDWVTGDWYIATSLIFRMEVLDILHTRRIVLS